MIDGDSVASLKSAEVSKRLKGQANTQIKVTTEGAKIKLGSTIGTLATGKAGGEIDVSGTLTADYTVLVAFHVPAADSKDKTVQVVGASDPILLSVSNG